MIDDHDPLCLRDPDDPDHSPCQCYTIARVRADERRRIADAIEAQPIDHRSRGRVTISGQVTFARREAYERAARIARDGGQR